MSAPLVGTPAGPSEIQLFALFGRFRIASSPFVIGYASTFATAQPGTGHRDLLRELQPVRDRVDPRQLNDLRSLLQRDLNDARVAEELIPYLKGQRAKLGFFPSLLAVLVPKGYLSGEGLETAYPAPTEASDSRDFGGCWRVERYKLEGQLLPLGRLIIAQAATEIVVLDGQHRGNAFRYLSSDFDPTDSIYKPFYEHAGPPVQLDADLPVTLLWFESEDSQKIEPKLIARRLFVDVNNNAKKVSRARTILLDDRSVVAVATQEVYNKAASRGFAPSQLSLLHNAFDMDSDLSAGRLHPLVLTTPEIVEDCVTWGFFGTTRYSELTQWRVRRLHPQANRARFEKLFPEVSGDIRVGEKEDSSRVMFKDGAKVDEFRKLVAQRFSPVFHTLFDDWKALSPHFYASGAVDKWAVDGDADTTQREAWRRVFCGGEGLYWSFRDAEETSLTKAYRRAIGDIERKFLDERATRFKGSVNDVNQVYQSIATKAFQVGYVMATDYLASNRTGGDHLKAAKGLIARMNAFGLEQWKVVFAQLRPLLMKGTDPKDWPAYQNLLLRLHSRDLFKDEETPEWHAYGTLLSDTARAASRAGGAMPTGTEVEAISQKEHKRVVDAFKKAGIDVGWFADKKWSKKGQDVLREYIDQYFQAGEGAEDEEADETDD